MAWIFIFHRMGSQGSFGYRYCIRKNIFKTSSTPFFSHEIPPKIFPIMWDSPTAVNHPKFITIKTHMGRINHFWGMHDIWFHYMKRYGSMAMVSPWFPHGLLVNSDKSMKITWYHLNIMEKSMNTWPFPWF